MFPDTSAARITGRGDQRVAELVHALTPIDRIKPALTGRYLVKGLLDRGALSCLFGAPNSGKTFAALDLAAHVAAGSEWFGHRVLGAAPVIYATAEGASAFGNRIAALRATKPALFAQAARGGMAVLPVALDLCHGDDARSMIEMVSGVAENPSLIVIDTLARSMGAGNENDGADMGAVIRAVSEIQERTGAHVMLVHHSGKNSSLGARGHSSLLAALDTELELTEAGGLIQLVARKQRDLASGPPKRFQLRTVYIGDDEDGDEVFSCVINRAIDPAERGALTLNEGRKQEAAGRAGAALRLLPFDRDFTVSDVADSFVAAEIVRASTQKSIREATRAKLKSMAGSGALTDLGGGLFRVTARVAK